MYVLLLLGGQAVGGPLMGWMVETYGAHVGMAVSGLAPVVAAVVIGIVLARQGQLRLRISLRREPRFLSIVTRSPRDEVLVAGQKA
ncbi:hypothetical protein GCM10009563_26590 [Subtercola frigoramans]